MLPSGYVLHDLVIPVYANEPIDPANQQQQEKIQGWNRKCGLGHLGIRGSGDQLRNYGGNSQKIPDPELRKRRKISRLSPVL
jgi:hypothetical protein